MRLKSGWVPAAAIAGALLVGAHAWAGPAAAKALSMGSVSYEQGVAFAQQVAKALFNVSPAGTSEATMARLALPELHARYRQLLEQTPVSAQIVGFGEIYEHRTEAYRRYLVPIKVSVKKGTGPAESRTRTLQMTVVRSSAGLRLADLRVLR